MSSTIDKLVARGKAKVKEFQGQSQNNWHGQNQAPQQQYQQQYPPYQYQQQYPQQNYQYQQQSPPPQQQQQWGSPPQQQWGPPQPQHQQSFGLPQPQHQQSFGPPIPLASKPTSSLQPPPIPQNRPVTPQPSYTTPQGPPPQQPQQQQQQPQQQTYMSSPPPPPPQNFPPQGTETVYWQPSFADNTHVTFNFRHEIGDHGWGNNEKQMYTSDPANSFHHDNRLIVRGLVSNGSYTSARLTSRQTLGRPRGYLTATILAPSAEGIWPAYWLLPEEPMTWPVDGEVDIFESWNGDNVNHSCLHWGHYNGEDWNKHRVIETPVADMSSRPHVFGFAWSEEDGIPGWRGRMVWYVDGRPVMKAHIPPGTRKLQDFRILINMAMGGNVCQGKLPRDGYYDLIVSKLKMCAEPPQGWGHFEHAWGTTPEGKTM